MQNHATPQHPPRDPRDTIEQRLKTLLPAQSDAMYVGQRMVTLTVNELEEVISTIADLRDELVTRRRDVD